MSAMTSDTKADRAGAAAALLRAALVTALPEFTVKMSEYSVYVHLPAPPEGEAEWRTEVATVSVNVTRRDYWKTVVQVKVRPSYQFRRDTRKTVIYWAGEDKDFVVDPEKVAAKVRALAEQLREQFKADAERRVWQEADEAQKAAHAEPVYAYLKDVSAEVGYNQRVREWSVTSSGTFDVKLQNLTEAEMLAVLAVVAPEGGAK